MSIAIEPIGPTDLDDILIMAAELSAHEGMQPPELTRDKLEAVIFGPDRLLSGLVARRDAKAVGYCLWETRYDMQYGTRVLHIVDLFVKAPLRRQGIATALVTGMAREALRRNFGFMTVSTYSGNAEARGFYAASGGRLDHSSLYYFARNDVETLAADTA